MCGYLHFTTACIFIQRHRIFSGFFVPRFPTFLSYESAIHVCLCLCTCIEIFMNIFNP